MCRAPRGALAWRYPSALGGALGMVVRFSVLFSCAGRTCGDQPMNTEHFYLTEPSGKRTGPFSANEIAELRERGLLDANSTLTDSHGTTQTAPQRCDAHSRPNQQPPPPVPTRDDSEGGVANEAFQLLRRFFLIGIAIGAVRLIFWLLSEKRRPTPTRRQDAEAQRNRMWDRPTTPPKLNSHPSNRDDQTKEGVRP